MNVLWHLFNLMYPPSSFTVRQYSEKLVTPKLIQKYIRRWSRDFSCSVDMRIKVCLSTTALQPNYMGEKCRAKLKGKMSCSIKYYIDVSANGQSNSL